MQFAAMNSVTLKGLNKRDAGSGNSLFSMVQRLAIGLGVTIGGGLVGLFSGPDNAMLMRAFMLTFLCVGAITLLSAVVFRRPRRGWLSRCPPLHHEAGRVSQWRMGVE